MEVTAEPGWKKNALGARRRVELMMKRCRNVGI
jgi:hypothetical protein